MRGKQLCVRADESIHLPTSPRNNIETRAMAQTIRAKVLATKSSNTKIGPKFLPNKIDKRRYQTKRLIKVDVEPGKGRNRAPTPTSPRAQRNIDHSIPKRIQPQLTEYSSSPNVRTSLVPLKDDLPRAQAEKSSASRSTNKRRMKQVIDEDCTTDVQLKQDLHSTYII
jgi:hypothetical protein